MLAFATVLASCGGGGGSAPPGSGPGGGPGGGPARQAGIATFVDAFGPGSISSPFASIQDPGACVAADFNADGLTDFFFAAGVFVFGHRSGAYIESVPLQTRGGLACVAADLDGDGDIDVVRGGRSGSYVAQSVGLNDGVGGFVDSAGGSWGAIPEWLTSVRVVDVDRDGDQDLVATFTSRAFGTVRLFLNDGAASFVDASSRMPFRSTTANDVVVADLDGDLIDDLLIVGPSEVQVWVGDGAGGFVDRTATLIPSSPLVGVTHIAAGDLDGDLDTDFVVVNGDALGIYRNSGGVFAPVAAAAGEATSVQVQDADGDGDLDLAVTQVTGINLYLNDGAAGFTDLSGQLVGLDTTQVGHLMLWQDVDASGTPDFMLSRGRAGAQFFRAVSLLDYWSAPSTPSSGSITAFEVFNVTPGDFDSDGDQDLMTRVALGTVAHCEIRWNDGAARFSRSPMFQMPRQSRHMTAADLDGDGQTDLLTELGWYRGGALPFVLGAHWPGGRVATDDPRAFDADGDGDLDVALAGEFGLSWIENRAGALFEHRLLAREIDDFEVVDMDLDGDLDLVALPVGGVLNLLLNDGAGGFADASVGIERPDQPIHDLAVADVNLDGALDFVVVGFAPGGNELFSILNAGNGQFVIGEVIRQAYGIGNENFRRVSSADMDADGDTDLILWVTIGGTAGGRTGVEVVFHDGVDAYLETSWTKRHLIRALDDVVAVDLDGDRDLDLIWATGPDYHKALPAHIHSGNGLVYLNQHRSLRSFGTALTGSDYVLTLEEGPGYQAAARSAAILIGGPSPSVVIPLLGRLFVTAPFATVPVVIPPSTGSTQLVIPIPPGSLPGGFELHAQGVFVGASGLPEALSNPRVDLVVR